MIHGDRLERPVPWSDSAPATQHDHPRLFGLAFIGTVLVIAVTTGLTVLLHRSTALPWQDGAGASWTVLGVIVPYGVLWYANASFSALVLVAWSAYGIHRWWSGLPARTRRAEQELQRTRAALEHAHVRHAELRSHLERMKRSLETEMEERRRLLGQVPPHILDYYQQGHHKDHHAAELRRMYKREATRWEAIAATFHTGALEPLFDMMAQTVRDEESGVHHLTNEEVMVRLAGVSTALRENDWFGRALRWMEAKYG